MLLEIPTSRLSAVWLEFDPVNLHRLILRGEINTQDAEGAWCRNGGRDGLPVAGFESERRRLRLIRIGAGGDPLDLALSALGTTGAECDHGRTLGARPDAEERRVACAHHGNDALLHEGLAVAGLPALQRAGRSGGGELTLNLSASAAARAAFQAWGSNSAMRFIG